MTSVIGSRTNAGISANIASAAVIKDGDRDIATIYEITYKDGMLEIDNVQAETVYSA